MEEEGGCFVEDPRAKGRLMSARDTHLRSVCKAISWRVIATLTTTLIAYFVTGKWETALFDRGVGGPREDRGVHPPRAGVGAHPLWPA